jgi:hypothetical protein
MYSHQSSDSGMQINKETHRLTQTFEKEGNTKRVDTHGLTQTFDSARNHDIFP